MKMQQAQGVSTDQWLLGYSGGIIDSVEVCMTVDNALRFCLLELASPKIVSPSKQQQGGGLIVGDRLNKSKVSFKTRSNIELTT